MMRGGRIRGLGRDRTTFFLTKVPRTFPISTSTAGRCGVPQWIIELEARGRDGTVAGPRGRGRVFSSNSCPQSSGRQAGGRERHPGWGGALTASDGAESARPRASNACSGDGAAVEAMGIPPERYGSYADRRWGRGWRINPHGRGRAWDELSATSTTRSATLTRLRPNSDSRHEGHSPCVSHTSPIPPGPRPSEADRVSGGHRPCHRCGRAGSGHLRGRDGPCPRSACTGGRTPGCTGSAPGRRLPCADAAGHLFARTARDADVPSDRRQAPGSMPPTASNRWRLTGRGDGPVTVVVIRIAAGGHGRALLPPAHGQQGHGGGRGGRGAGGVGRWRTPWPPAGGLLARRTGWPGRRGLPTIGVPRHGLRPGRASMAPMAGFDHEFTTGALFAAETQAFMSATSTAISPGSRDSKAGGSWSLTPGPSGAFTTARMATRASCQWEDATRASATPGADTPARRDRRHRLSKADRSLGTARGIGPAGRGWRSVGPMDRGEEDRSAVDRDAIQRMLGDAAKRSRRAHRACGANPRRGIRPAAPGRQAAWGRGDRRHPEPLLMRLAELGEHSPEEDSCQRFAPPRRTELRTWSP